jgi:hypothetical protein
VIPSKRKAGESAQGSHESTPELTSVAEDEGNIAEDVGNADSNSALWDRPIGTRAAKDIQKLAKSREGDLYS